MIKTAHASFVCVEQADVSWLVLLTRCANVWGGVGNYTRINKIILIKIILKNFQLENHDRQGYRQARAVDVMDEEAEVYRKLAQKML